MGPEKFARDKSNKALLNTDNESYEAYIASRADFYKIQNLNNEVTNLKNDMSEIKSLLKELIKGNNNV